MWPTFELLKLPILHIGIWHGSKQQTESRKQLLESKIAFENHICLVAASNVVCQSLLDSMNPEFDFQNGILNSIYRQYTQEDTWIVSWLEKIRL